MRTLIGFLFGFLLMVYFGFLPLGTRVVAYKHDVIDNIGYTAVQEAKMKGYFSQADISSIKQTVANAIGYPVSDVNVQATTTFTPYNATMIINISIPTHLSLISLGNNTTTTITAGHSARSEALGT